MLLHHLHHHFAHHVLTAALSALRGGLMLPRRLMLAGSLMLVV
jgi:hypothetical protein